MAELDPTPSLSPLVQSVKAEPFKRWLAQVGYERVKEIENPELASARARELYQAKGYPQAWIEKRLSSSMPTKGGNPLCCPRTEE